MTHRICLVLPATVKIMRLLISRIDILKEEFRLWIKPLACLLPVVRYAVFVLDKHALVPLQLFNSCIINKKFSNNFILFYITFHGWNSPFYMSTQEVMSSMIFQVGRQNKTNSLCPIDSSGSLSLYVRDDHIFIFAI